jgi:AcrR family transcriptional regulator
MPARPPLSPARIVEAAAEVADSGGLTAVSMRHVGKALGVEAMSLYHHVSSKEALIDALVEWLYAKLYRPDSDQPWRTEMALRAQVARTVLLAHPWGLGLIESRRRPGPEVLGHHESVLACLRGNGFTVAQAAHAFSVLDAYVFGFVLTELSLPIQDATDATEMAAEMALDPADYPHLVEMMVGYVMAQDYTYAGAEFEHGLELILDALASRLAVPAR